MMEKVTEAVFLGLALSADTFTAGFSYGLSGVKIPRMSMLVLNLMCGAILGLALLAGAVFGKYLPEQLEKWGCFALLLLIGLAKLLDGIAKSLIRRYGAMRGQLKFSAFNFRFVLNLYADPDKADIDGSKTLSPAEAVCLAFALSIDAAAAGFGSAMGSGDVVLVFVMATVMNFVALLCGERLGGRLSKKLPSGMAWLSGAALVAIAVTKVI